MRILHITTSLDNGGAQAILFNLAIRSKEHHQTVISLMDDGKYGGLLRQHGLDVYTLDNRNGRFSLASFRKLFDLIKKLNPDLIQTWMYHADLVGGITGRLAGVRNIVWGIHNTNMDVNRTSKSTLLIIKTLALISSFAPKRIAVCSRRAMEQHIEKGYNKSKMVFIPNGYDLHRFRPVNNSEQNGVLSKFIKDRSDTVIGCVGRWSEQKDQMNLVLACRELVDKGKSDFVCIFIGPGIDSDNEVLSSAIAEYSLASHVFLAGVFDDIPAVMNSIDIHVLPSAFGEAFPNVVAEAMSCGTPCIVTDVGDSNDMVQDAGWVVEPSNPTLLANAMLEAFNELNSQHWFDRKEKCRQIAVDNFNIDTMVSKYKSTWDIVSAA